VNAVVKAVAPGSPASRTGIAPGDVLRRINGNAIGDVLDYKYRSYDADIMLEFAGKGGKLKLVRLRKPEGADIGLEFDTFLMDSQRSCANKCVFCFVDQLPDGMRESLYYKDDDVRLSFLQGNYVTLTNLSRRDVERIVQLRISPINVSVHTLDPELRNYMLGTTRGAAGIAALKALAEAKIELNCQIVCCPGINDGAELERSMDGLCALGPAVNSVSVVPVGLTKHRQRLEPLRPFDRALALETVRQVWRYSEKCLRKRGSRVFFCADELYMKAGLKLPPHGHYEDYPQLENGVGMMRLFITEFEEELARLGGRQPMAGSHSACAGCRRAAGTRGPGAKTYSQAPDAKYSEFSIVTGAAACKYLTNLLKIAIAKCDKIAGRVYAIRNDFFGESVTVSGLVTGGDIVAQLRGRALGTRLLIPQNMLRHGEDVFLDNVTVSEVSEALGVPIRVVRQDGADLLRAAIGAV